MKVFLSNFLNISHFLKTGQTALMLAAGTGRVDIVDLLLQCGAAKSINATDLVRDPFINTFYFLSDYQLK